MPRPTLDKVKTWYVIRTGWNAANQSSMGACRKPINDFESHHHKLVGVIDATDAADAIENVGASCYNGQKVIAVDGLRKVKGLTQAVRDYRSDSLLIAVLLSLRNVLGVTE